MHAKLTWELHTLTIIEEEQVSYLECLLLDVPIMPSLRPFLLCLLMESCDEAIFL